MRRFCAGFDGFQLVSKYAHAHVQYYAIYNIFFRSPLPLYSHHQFCLPVLSRSFRGSVSWLPCYTYQVVVCSYMVLQS